MPNLLLLSAFLAILLPIRLFLSSNFLFPCLICLLWSLGCSSILYHSLLIAVLVLLFLAAVVSSHFSTLSVYSLLFSYYSSQTLISISCNCSLTLPIHLISQSSVLTSAFQSSTIYLCSPIHLGDHTFIQVLVAIYWRIPMNSPLFLVLPPFFHSLMSAIC